MSEEERLYYEHNFDSKCICIDCEDWRGKKMDEEDEERPEWDWLKKKGLSRDIYNRR